jgi:hypothetical protein
MPSRAISSGEEHRKNNPMCSAIGPVPERHDSLVPFVFVSAKARGEHTSALVKFSAEKSWNIFVDTEDERRQGLYNLITTTAS